MTTLGSAFYHKYAVRLDPPLKDLLRKELFHSDNCNTAVVVGSGGGDVRIRSIEVLMKVRLCLIDTIRGDWQTFRTRNFLTTPVHCYQQTEIAARRIRD